MEYYSSTLLLLFSPRQSHKSCWHSHIYLIMYRASEIYGKNSEKCHNRPTTSSITWSIPQPQQQRSKGDHSTLLIGMYAYSLTCWAFFIIFLSNRTTTEEDKNVFVGQIDRSIWKGTIGDANDQLKDTSHSPPSAPSDDDGDLVLLFGEHINSDDDEGR